ncbi:hypothetical protein BDB01DRAFT_776933 [Pilobolus umbonatus]|nr:hypothetical protein BDB01DRAFT_776933 [Pilobolus umbonatus]
MSFKLSSGIAVWMVTMVTAVSIPEHVYKRQEEVKSTKSEAATKTNTSATKAATKTDLQFSNKPTSSTKSVAKTSSTKGDTTEKAIVPDISTTSGVTTSSPTLQSTSAASTSDANSSSSMIGAIVAIVLIILSGFVAFFILKRKKKVGQNKNRRSGAPDPFTMGYGNNDPIPYTENKPYHQPVQINPTNFYEVPMAPSHTVNNEMTQSQPLPSLSLGSFVVIATYIPTLSDELEIEVGDQVQLLAEYDDGWCQGMNMSKGYTKGVFPRHCIDYASIQPSYAAGKDFERSKRISSMNRY